MLKSIKLVKKLVKFKSVYSNVFFLRGDFLILGSLVNFRNFNFYNIPSVRIFRNSEIHRIFGFSKVCFNFPSFFLNGIFFFNSLQFLKKLPNFVILNYFCLNFLFLNFRRLGVVRFFEFFDLFRFFSFFFFLKIFFFFFKFFFFFLFCFRFLNFSSFFLATIA